MSYRSLYLDFLAGDPLSYTPEEDWYLLKTKRRPACPATEQPPPLLIIVKSFVGNANLRDTIRKTWGMSAQKRGARVVFIVGHRKGYVLSTW